MDEKTQEELKNALLAHEGTSPQTDEVTTEPVKEEVKTEIDPLKVELERVKTKKTPEQKAKDSLFFNAEQAKKLGLDPAEILGIKKEEPKEVEEDEKPLTRKDLLEFAKTISTNTVVKTATELASEITDETERELTLYHIENTIKSTGDPKEDLRLARALTNSVRNSLILEESERKPQAKTHSSASGAGSGEVKPQVVLTPEEKTYLATGLVTQEEILLAREGKPIKS